MAERLKRYAVFSFDDYYPGGGFNDFAASFDTVDDAAQHASELRHDNKSIIDLESGDDVTPEWVWMGRKKP